MGCGGQAFELEAQIEYQNSGGGASAGGLRHEARGYIEQGKGPELVRPDGALVLPAHSCSVLACARKIRTRLPSNCSRYLC